MNVGELFRRACVSGFVCSIFYHGLMLLMGTKVQLRSAVVFTVVFVLLYFVWLLVVSYKGRR
ncbi:MAG: hypothetical protein HFE61_02715 [Anaerotignum sp.]|jgi:hypothetical protein|nr:hypothetical protein [Anaerotignum sp.]MCI8867045.1 hypothetical protein [Anaerotignum sp.]